MSETYKKYSDGDFSISLILRKDGKKYSLENIYTELNMFESMLSHSLTGHIQIIDSNNLLNSMDMVGFDEIEVVFNTAAMNKTITQTFVIYKIDDIISINEHTVSYRLYFTTRESIENNKVIVCKRFLGNVSNSIPKVMAYLETAKEVEVEESVGLVDYIAPSISPFKVIDTLTKLSANKDTNNASFMFFETMNGYKFKSIESIIAEEPKIRYQKNLVMLEDHENEDYHDKLFKSYEKMAVGPRADVLKNIQKGVYSNRYLSHDIFSKAYKYVDFSRDSVLTLEGNITLPDSEKFVYTQTKGVITTHLNRTDSTSEYKSPHSRMSVINGLLQNIVNIQVSGNIELSAGDVVEFWYPTNSVDYSIQEQVDKYLKGKRIIVAVRHTLSKQGYTQVLELAKDSYAEGIK